MTTTDEQVEAVLASLQGLSEALRDDAAFTNLMTGIAIQLDQLGWRPDGSSWLRIVRQTQATPATNAGEARGFQGVRLEELSHVGPAVGTLEATPRELLPGLRDCLERDGVRFEAEWLWAYVLWLTTPAVRELGWHRSIDAHVIAMIATERLTRTSRVPPSLWDAAVFGWLHELTYQSSPPVDWLLEATHRREVRKRFGAEAIETVLGAACEVPLSPTFIDGLTCAAPGAALTMDQVGTFWRNGDRLAATWKEPLPEPADWLERIDAMTQDPRVSLDEQLTHGVATGSLVGWWLRNSVAVDVPMLAVASAYATCLIEELTPRSDVANLSEELLAMHLRCIGAASDPAGSPIPLVTELALWAWLLHVADSDGSLLDYLQMRERATPGRSWSSR